MTPPPPSLPATEERLYTRQFFQVFGAVMLFMTGVALQFHFGEYVEFLGHDVQTLGWVLGISVFGTLASRLHIGRWIDRFGCRPTWLVGAVIVAVTAGLVQFTGRLWLIVLLRTISVMATAAVMTTVAVFAALIAPPQRRAESLGTIGLGGFTGMIIGATLGDFIFGGGTDSAFPFRVFFTASAACALAAGLVMVSLDVSKTLGERRPLMPQAAESAPLGPSQLRMIRLHWPGMILLVGLVFHMAFCLQSSFLERLADARRFQNIKLFFLVYGPTAITLRLLCRRLPEQLGRSRTLVGGLVLFAAGIFSLAGVHAEWQLVLPGLLMGAGHCFIFPSMVDLAAERLPGEYRGTGTALILGAGDLGLLLGFIIFGSVIDHYGFDLALQALASSVLVGAALYALSRWRVLLGLAPDMEAVQSRA